MAVILDARRLNKSFGAVTAASDISAGIEEDSVVGLIGTNGAGKTTFINMITGYLKPDRGSIHYAGRDITALSPREITGLGVVLRNAGLGGFFSRGRPVVPGHDAPAEEVAERILAQFGLADYRAKNAQVLPGGVRKLLDIALTMVARPRVLLLDEPTSGVSAEEKFGVMELILKAVKAQGATVLFVEHDMEVVARFAERVLAFYDGRIIADAPPQVALNHREVKRFVVGGELHRLDERQGAAHA